MWLHNRFLHLWTLGKCIKVTVQCLMLSVGWFELHHPISSLLLQVNLKMRVRISYSRNGSTFQDMIQIDSLPGLGHWPQLFTPLLWHQTEDDWAASRLFFFMLLLFKVKLLLNHRNNLAIFSDCWSEHATVGVIWKDFKWISCYFL